jgi:hypothetical protein
MVGDAATKVLGVQARGQGVDADVILPPIDDAVQLAQQAATSRWPTISVTSRG